MPVATTISVMAQATAMALAAGAAEPVEGEIGGRFQFGSAGDQNSAASLPHDSKKHILMNTSISITAIMLLVVLLRLYSRIIVLHTIHWDDWLIIPSALFSIMMTIFICLNAAAGGGNHVWDINSENLVWMVKVRLSRRCAFRPRGRRT